MPLQFEKLTNIKDKNDVTINVGEIVIYPDTGAEFKVYWDNNQKEYGLKPLAQLLPKYMFIPLTANTFTIKKEVSLASASQ